jgi:prophage antirepressor-like protein
MEIPAGQVAVTTRYQIKYADIRHIYDEFGNPWFVAKDVCDYLGLDNVSEACSRVWDDAKQKYSVTSVNDIRPGISSTDTSLADQGREMLIVSEPGLYQLIFMSRKPEADAFRRWVFYELLPQLRRDGKYHLQRSRHQMLLPAISAGSVYAGRPAAPTRLGRQPLLDVLRARGLKNDDSFRAMNELDLPGVPQFNTTYMDQARGKLFVKPGLALRASAYLNLPVEELFTEESRSRLPAQSQQRSWAGMEPRGLMSQEQHDRVRSLADSAAGRIPLPHSQTALEKAIQQASGLGHEFNGTQWTGTEGHRKFWQCLRCGEKLAFNSAGEWSMPSGRAVCNGPTN